MLFQSRESTALLRLNLPRKRIPPHKYNFKVLPRPNRNASPDVVPAKHTLCNNVCCVLRDLRRTEDTGSDSRRRPQ